LNKAEKEIYGAGFVFPLLIVWKIPSGS